MAQADMTKVGQHDLNHRLNGAKCDDLVSIV